MMHLLSQVTDADMQRMIVEGSSKIIPYVISSRKAVKEYLKVSLAWCLPAQDWTS